MFLIRPVQNLMACYCGFGTFTYRLDIFFKYVISGESDDVIPEKYFKEVLFVKN